MERKTRKIVLAALLAFLLVLVPTGSTLLAAGLQGSNGNFSVSLEEPEPAADTAAFTVSAPSAPVWKSNPTVSQPSMDQATGLAFLESVAAQREHGLTLQKIINRVKANPEVSMYVNDTFYRVVEDSLSVEKLNRSLDFIIQANSYRSQNPLYVSAEQMMVAAVSNGIFQASHDPHNLFYSDQELYGDTCPASYVYIAENLAEGYADPFEGWYEYEGGLYAQGDRSANVGHYVVLMDPKYSLTGFSTAYDGVSNLTAPYAHAQVFGNADSLANYMTPADFLFWESIF